MRPNDVTPVPVEGQLWAATNPLALMQCVLGGDQIVHFKAWYPHRIAGLQLNREEASYDAVVFVWPVLDVRYLWSRIRLPIARIPAVFGNRVPQVGDIWYLTGSELFFIGPDTNEEYVQILADWDCGEVFLAPEEDHREFYTQLFQPGPNHAEPVPSLAVPALDRLLGDRELV